MQSLPTNALKYSVLPQMVSYSKGYSSAKRRRTDNVTKTKYQAPTAKNQKRQIMSNALAIQTVKRLIPPPIYTDWQIKGEHVSAVDQTGFFTGYRTTKLLEPADWGRCLRQDVDVENSSGTRILRMKLNLRLENRAADRSTMHCFVVSLRENAANRGPDFPGWLSEPADYIRSFQDQDVTLNSAVFKVHAHKCASLTQNGWGIAPYASVAPGGGSETLSGNPQTTWKEHEINMDINLDIKQPNGLGPWKDMSQEQLKASRRLMLITFFWTLNPDGTQTPNLATVQYQAVFSCYNAA